VVGLAGEDFREAAGGLLGLVLLGPDAFGVRMLLHPLVPQGGQGLEEPPAEVAGAAVLGKGDVVVGRFGERGHRRLEVRPEARGGLGQVFGDLGPLAHGDGLVEPAAGLHRRRARGLVRHVEWPVAGVGDPDRRRPLAPVVNHPHEQAVPPGRQPYRHGVLVGPPGAVDLAGVDGPAVEVQADGVVAADSQTVRPLLRRLEERKEQGGAGVGLREQGAQVDASVGFGLDGEPDTPRRVQAGVGGEVGGQVGGIQPLCRQRAADRPGAEKPARAARRAGALCRCQRQRGRHQEADRVSSEGGGHRLRFRLASEGLNTRAGGKSRWCFSTRDREVACRRERRRSRAPAVWSGARTWSGGGSARQAFRARCVSSGVRPKGGARTTWAPMRTRHLTMAARASGGATVA